MIINERFLLTQHGSIRGKVRVLRYLQRKKDIIFENKYFFAQFDSFPVNPGHAEVIPIRHMKSLGDLTEAEWKELRPAIRAVVLRIDKASVLGKLEMFYRLRVEKPINENSKKLCQEMLEHDGLGSLTNSYTHGVNDGRLAGRTIDHLHWHIIPRFAGDVEDPTGGVRHVIPSRGNYKKR
jgi:diadenosine tetraphosphate (Ap4A) HIT family hydrolase